MRRALILSLATLLATTALAGCTGGDDGPVTQTTPVVTTPVTTPEPTTTTPVVSTPPPAANESLDSSTYAIAFVGAPTLAKPNQTWTATLFVNGTMESTSDHLGAHYADNDTFAPNATAMQSCAHEGGALPGQFNVSCSMGAEGTWFVWGHARVTDADGPHNWWAATPVSLRVRDYTIITSGFPSNAQASGSNFTFQVDVRGVHNDTTDHIGAHFWNASEPNPTIQNSAGSCVHIGSGIVGNYTIACSIPNSGLAPRDFFVRGHARLSENGTSIAWWSAETKVSILGSLPGSPI